MGYIILFLIQYRIVSGRMQLRWADPIQLETNLTFGLAWAIIFNIQVELELGFFNPISIWVGLKVKFKQPEPNPNSI